MIPSYPSYVFDEKNIIIGEWHGKGIKQGFKRFKCIRNRD